jgi:hypothetical protein
LPSFSLACRLALVLGVSLDALTSEPVKADDAA